MPRTPALLFGLGCAGVNLQERSVNGQPGLVATHEGSTIAVYAFDIVGDRIQRIWVVRNPDKLRSWTRH